MDLSQLQQAISDSINRELGTAQLIPGTKAGVEVPVDDLPTSVSAMTSFELVPNLGYRFGYFDYRYMLIGYLLQRGSDYESGQIEIISTAPAQDPQVEVYTPDTLYIKKLQSQITGTGGLGVEFGTAYDSDLSEGGQHQFGLTYKITQAGTSIPKIRAFLIAVLSTTEA